jgi:hypothetical protein
MPNGKWANHKMRLLGQRDEARGQKQNFRKEPSKISNCRIKETDRRRMGARELILKKE